jgi:hypothetical protein
LQRVGYATVGIEIRGIPPFAKNAKDGAPGRRWKNKKWASNSLTATFCW